MALITGQKIFMHQKSFFGSLQFLKRFQLLRLSNSLASTEVQVENNPEKKLLKVAIIGRPNAGKSTLINSILKLNLCGVSHKTHTTRTPFRAAFIRGETQIVFMDTPGLVTQKEFSRFELDQKFLTWKQKVLNEADVIGIIHEIAQPKNMLRFHLNLTQNINALPESKPLFLVLNKIDLVMDKEALSQTINVCLNLKNPDSPASSKTPRVLQKFSKIFFTAALNNTGVDEIVEYLIEQAKQGEWLFKPGKVFDKPLNVLIENLVRASLMDILPQEIPFQCKYNVEYLKENSIGEVYCVVLVICKNSRHAHLITSGKKGSLRVLCKQLESDLYKILEKVFRIRLVVRTKQGS